MAHKEQRDFFHRVRALFPEYFTGGRILEIGSLNINGSCRELFFEPAEYHGIDLGAGKGVDEVISGHEFDRDAGQWDVIISGEMFEHNANWADTWKNMLRLVRKRGIIIFTCATKYRAEHGTPKCSPDSAPFTTDYYGNREPQDFLGLIDPYRDFHRFAFEVNNHRHDLYFWGIRS